MPQTVAPKGPCTLMVTDDVQRSGRLLLRAANELLRRLRLRQNLSLRTASRALGDRAARAA
eukprot:8861681-Pyramimonas_sp.AAC.1